MKKAGVISSNFMMNLKMAGSGQDSNNKNKDLPYIQLTNNILEASKQMMQNTTHPSEVANVILEAIMADNPNLRYIVGKDAAMLIEARRNMSDREFQESLKKQFNL